ncbi:MAG: radical SAM protein [Deltaproteobacteria bacterium]|nr:radical SAM protein [Deltaproteobacteria bacterium]MBW2154456.1 radical SAM protein [Deltaproteobacteria bacterium]
MSQNLKTMTAQQAARTIIGLLPKISDENLVRLTHFGKRLTHDPETLRAIDRVQAYLKTPDHPAKVLFRKVLDYLPDQRRIRLFETLFNGAFFEGGKLRDKWEAELGFRPPFIMILSPTLHCNLRCKGCYTLGYGMRPQLPLEIADRLLWECEELGIYFVTILGGEPLVYPHLFTLIERHPRIFFQVYTNGTLMTREKAERFAELGNTVVVVSIEGGEHETDRWRGEGVYRRIMKCFEYLNDARVIIGTSATVTRQNVQVVSSFRFIDEMISMGSMAQMYFLYIPVNGKADFSLMVTPKQRDHLRRQVIRTRDTRPIFVLDFWNDGPYVEGCIAGGRRYFHVNANGDVEPCVYTHIAQDNIKEKPLKEALNSPLFRHIRTCQPHNPNHLRPCMIIDNPQVMREVIQKTGARFTHPGAEEIYTVHKDKMDAYAARWGELADRIWKTEYQSGGEETNESPVQQVVLK